MCTEEVQTDHTVVKTPILIVKTLGYRKMKKYTFNKTYMQLINIK